MFIMSRRNQRWGCLWEQGVEGLLFILLLLSDSLASWSVKAGQGHVWSVQLLFRILNTQYHPTLPTPSSPPAAAREHLQRFYAWQPQPRDSKWKLRFFPGKPLLDLGGPEDYHLRLAACREQGWPLQEAEWLGALHTNAFVFPYLQKKQTNKHAKKKEKSPVEWTCYVQMG